MKKVLFLMFILILLTDIAFAVHAPVSENPTTGKPVYEDVDTSTMIIDNTKKEIRLPSGKIIIVDANAKEDALPEDLQMLGIEEENTGDTGNTELTEGDLPEDMADILGDDGGDGANSSGGNNFYSNGGNTGNSSSEGNSNYSTVGADNGDDTGDIAVNNSNSSSGNEDASASTLKFLWFAMACLIILLIIAVVYLLSTKKAKTIEG